MESEGARARAHVCVYVHCVEIMNSTMTESVYRYQQHESKHSYCVRVCVCTYLWVYDMYVCEPVCKPHF